MHTVAQPSTTRSKSRPRSTSSERAPLSAAGYYSRELDRYPIMSHDEQMALGQSITLHRQTIRGLAITIQLAVRGNTIPTEFIAPIVNLSKSQGFSVEELRHAAACVGQLLPHIPVDLHDSLRAIQTQMTSPLEDYALCIDRLVSGNLRLVQRLVSSYLYDGTTREDLIQDGNLGLLKAAERFDPRANTTFSTYATHWIEQSMQRSLNTTRTISYPMEHLDEHRQVRHAQDALERRHESKPTDYEIAVYLNEQAKSKLEQRLRRPATLAEITDKCRWTVDKVKEHRTHSTTCLSLDETTDDAEQDTPSLLDTLANPYALDPETLYEQEQNAAIMKDVLRILNDVEREIVMHLSGFNAEPLSMTDLSAKLGFTRDKLRRMHLKALQKLKESLEARGFTRTTFNFASPGARR